MKHDGSRWYGIVFTLGLLTTACEGQLEEVEREVGEEPTQDECADTGAVTTTTPVADLTSATSDFDVVLEACEETPMELACNLGEKSLFEESSDGTTRTIVANGIANHDVDIFPNSGNPNTIAPQGYEYTLPVTPSGEGSAVEKTFGIATSGVVFEPGTAERWNDSDDWNYEALRYGGAPVYLETNDATHHPNELGLDCNFAHVQPNGSYHYHGVPTGLVPEDPKLILVGWAGDGYPIFGRWGHSDANDRSTALTEMSSSYRLKTGGRPTGSDSPGGDYDGTFVQDWEYEAGYGELDECNGREGVVVIDGEELSTYAYYLTYTYPYIPRCFKATPDPSFAAGPGGEAGGPPSGGGAEPPAG